MTATEKETKPWLADEPANADGSPAIVSFDPTVPDAAPADAGSAQTIIDENANEKDASGEMFYLDEDGNRSDAALHEAILAAGQESPEYIEGTKQVAREIGLTEEQIDQLYGFQEPRRKKG